MWVMANVFANDLQRRRRRAAGRRHHRREPDADCRATSTTSRRSPIRARRPCRCASSCRTTTTCSGATCSCASRSSRRDEHRGILVPRARRCCATIRTCRSCSCRGRQRLRAAPHRPRHARRRSVRSHVGAHRRRQGRRRRRALPAVRGEPVSEPTRPPRAPLPTTQRRGAARARSSDWSRRL